MPAAFCLDHFASDAATFTRQIDAPRRRAVAALVRYFRSGLPGVRGAAGTQARRFYDSRGLFQKYQLNGRAENGFSFPETEIRIGR
jgi:hypothetical protein